MISLLDPADLLRSGSSQASGSRKKSKCNAGGHKLQRQHSGCGSKLQQRYSEGGAGDLVDMSGIGGRDNSLFLFRALGKILYFKSMIVCALLICL